MRRHGEGGGLRAGHVHEGRSEVHGVGRLPDAPVPVEHGTWLDLAALEKWAGCGAEVYRNPRSLLIDPVHDERRCGPVAAVGVQYQKPLEPVANETLNRFDVHGLYCLR